MMARMAGFSAESSLYKTSGAYFTSYSVVSSTGGVRSALFQDPLRPYGGATVGLLDRCNLMCWLRCVYRDKVEKIICDLYCGCLD
jgi:hypothetical protein